MTISVKDASGTTQTVQTLNDLTKGTPSASDTNTLHVAIVTDQVSPLGPANTANSAPVVPAGYQYKAVAASQSSIVLGATGAVNDTLFGVLIVPATTAAGTVSIADGNATAMNIFVTGTLSNLVPFFVPLNIRATVATTPGWRITTGANVSVVGIGVFT